MADTTESVRSEGGAARRSRRRRRRRRAIVATAVGVVAVAGAGSAWAMSGTDSPTYRLVSAAPSDVEQTVDADGALSAENTATLSFAAAGTVSAVEVAVGDTVTAGQTLATLDPATLDAAVTSAQTALAEAKQTLANDQEAQADGTTVSASTSGSGSGSGAAQGGAANAGRSTSNAVAVNSAVTVRLTAEVTPSSSAGATRSARSAQQAVIKAQQTLDKAITTQDAAVTALVESCAASDDTVPATATVTAGDDGTVSGAAGSSPAIVTLRTESGDPATTSSTNPQRVTAGDQWTFRGLTSGAAYRVELVRSSVVDSSDCTDAVSTVVADQKDVDRASTSLAGAITALDKTVSAIPASTSTGNGAGTKTPIGSSRTGSATAPGGTGSGASRSGASRSGASASGASGSGASGSGASGSGASTGVLVTAARIAADTKTVDAKQAALAVAEQDRRHATLTSSLTGTVAAVAVAKGDTVSAVSSTATVTVVGSGTLSSVVTIGIADIDLVKVGQSVAVSVDGRTSTLPAHVTFIGTSNNAASTSSSATYPVTVALDKPDAALYDGMGVSLAIDVGTASDVLTVPLSAVHTIGTRSTVTVYDKGRTTTTPVTLGLVGEDRVQIKSGVKAGDRVVLAEVSAAVPSSTTSNRRGGTGVFTGGGTGAFTGNGPPAGGFGGPGGN